MTTWSYLHIFFATIFSLRLLTLSPFLPPVKTQWTLPILLLPSLFLTNSIVLFLSYTLASLLALRLTCTRSRPDAFVVSLYFIYVAIENRSPLVLLSLLFIIPALRADLSAVHTTFTVPPNVRTTSAFMLVSFEWVTPLLSLASTRPLEQADIPPLADRFRAKASSEAFTLYWRRSNSLTVTLVRSFGARLLMGGMFKLFNDIAQFASPMFLRMILVHLEASSVHTASGLYLAVLLFVSYLFQAYFTQQYFDNVYTAQTQVRSALISAVFSKATRLSPQGRQTSTTGQIQNLMSSDCRTVAIVPNYIHEYWSCAEHIVVALVFLVRLLGWQPVLAAILTLVSCIPLQAAVVKRQAILREQALKKTDERVKHVSEALGAIKLVKLYAWEIPFVRRVLKERGEELASLRSIAFLAAWNSLVMTSLNIVLMMTTFGVYVLVQKRIDASVVFPALALFDILFPSLMYLPILVNQGTHAKASLRRLGDFLRAEELPHTLETNRTIDQTSMERDCVDIAAEEASFSWNVEPDHQDPSLDMPRTLSSVTFKIPSGCLAAVVGPTGSGKSSLLMSCLGEIPIVSGLVGLRQGQSMSFCDQEAFICNSSFRENILFGKPYDEGYFHHVVNICSLQPDLMTLPLGDLTEIGLRGVNLSGGQRARVSLARAVYSRSDVYILDDPLSAVDAFVAKALFKECIVGELKQKTRLWATNQLQLAASEEVDMIIVVKNGVVVEAGERSLLVSDPNSQFSLLLAATGSHPRALDDEKIVSVPPKGLTHYARNGRLSGTCPIANGGNYGARENVSDESSTLLKKNGVNVDYNSMEAGRLTRAEGKSEGKVKFKHYRTYFAAIGFRWILLIVSCSALNVALGTATGLWLSSWIDEENLEIWLNMKIFIALGVGGIGAVTATNFFMAFASIKASHCLHERLLLSTFGAPMSFFYSTPEGRIVNRFSSDMDTLDSGLNDCLKFLLHLVLEMIFTIGLIVWALPLFFPIAIAIGVLGYFVQEFYRKSVVDLRRLQSLAYSPLYSHFTETLLGVRTLRAYDDVPRALHSNAVHVDELAKTVYASSLTRRWLGVRMNTLGALLIFGASILAMVAPADAVSTGLRGLILSYTISMFSVMRWVVKQLTEAESKFNCIERISEYSDTEFQQEERGPMKERLQAHMKTYQYHDQTSLGETPGLELLLSKPSSHVKVRTTSRWPQNGRIDFVDVNMKYREDLDPSLRNVSFTVYPGEHVGIVGRTGAGKSSAIECLFRLHNLERGHVLIDGKDISSMSLFELRSCLGIIPQESVCFSGTIRSNLDMFGEYEDSDVQNALDLCGLRDSMQGSDVSLDLTITENGSNLSVGQRQLLCLGRVLLKRSKILVLDEATSSVSFDTDAQIQETLRLEMARCTMLTVAHRLETVMQSDRIIVMDGGRIAEIGRPKDLLGRPSLFADMVNETGEVTAARLKSLAFRHSDDSMEKRHTVTE